MNKINGILLLLIYICFVTAIANELFVEASNISNVVRRTAFFGVIGIGVSFVIVTGGIDLSIGSLIALTGCILAFLLQVDYLPHQQWELSKAEQNSSTISLVISNKDPASVDTVAYFGGAESNAGFYSVDRATRSSGTQVDEDGNERSIDVHQVELTDSFRESDDTGFIQQVFEIDDVDTDYYDLIVDELPAVIRPRDRIRYFSPSFDRPQEVVVNDVFQQDGRYHIELAELPTGFSSQGMFAVVNRRALPVVVALAIVMGLSIALGLTHGLIITKVNLQPFVVTLCGLLIYRGIARTMTDDQSVGFGSEYANSLELVSSGTPCSVATLLLFSGVLVLLFSLIKLFKRSDSAGTPEEKRAALLTKLVIAGIGLILAIIGSARFWHGFEVDPQLDNRPPIEILFFDIPLWKYTVPEAGASLPGTLLTWCGILALPLGAWPLISALMSQGKAMSRSIVALVVCVAIFGLRWLALANDDVIFGGDTGWSKTLSDVSLFVSVAVLFFGIAYFSRELYRVAPPTAKPCLFATGVFCVMWLAGQTQIANTMVPAPFFVMLAVALTASLFMNQTIYGRYLLALGSNPQAARFSGIRTHRMTILAYVICSGCAGLAGILFAMDINSVQPMAHGNFYELYAIAAAVLGGCSLRGGEGTILGVVIGAAVMQVLRNSIFLMGIPDQLEFAIIGIVILVGVITDEVLRRVNRSRRAKLEAAT